MSCSAKGLLVCFLFGCVCFYRFYRYNNLTQDSVQLFILYFVAAKFVLWYSTYKQTAFVSLGFGSSTSPRTDSTLLPESWQILLLFSPIICRANAIAIIHLLPTARLNALCFLRRFPLGFLHLLHYFIPLEFLRHLHLADQQLPLPHSQLLDRQQQFPTPLIFRTPYQ